MSVFQMLPNPSLFLMSTVQSATLGITLPKYVKHLEGPCRSKKVVSVTVCPRVFSFGGIEEEYKFVGIV